VEKQTFSSKKGLQNLAQTFFRPPQTKGQVFAYAIYADKFVVLNISEVLDN